MSLPGASPWNPDCLVSVLKEEKISRLRCLPHTEDHQCLIGKLLRYEGGRCPAPASWMRAIEAPYTVEEGGGGREGFKKFMR